MPVQLCCWLAWLLGQNRQLCKLERWRTFVSLLCTLKPCLRESYICRDSVKHVSTSAIEGATWLVQTTFCYFPDPVPFTVAEKHNESCLEWWRWPELLNFTCKPLLSLTVLLGEPHPSPPSILSSCKQSTTFLLGDLMPWTNNIPNKTFITGQNALVWRKVSTAVTMAFLVTFDLGLVVTLLQAIQPKLDTHFSFVQIFLKHNSYWKLFN